MRERERERESLVVIGIIAWKLSDRSLLKCANIISIFYNENKYISVCCTFLIFY